jgi:hypothetical protein
MLAAHHIRFGGILMRVIYIVDPGSEKADAQPNPAQARVFTDASSAGAGMGLILA